MADEDSARVDGLSEVINLIAAPIASGIRQYEQFRRGVDELFRAIDNVNSTMENLNEAASRLNRLLGDVEDPLRAMIPQITRTVKAADEIVKVLEGPTRRVAPNLGKIVDTLVSPSFTSLPDQIGEVVGVMRDVSRRLGPLTQFAESAGGLFGLRLPGMARPHAEPAPAAAPAVVETAVADAATTGNGASEASPAAPGKKAAAKKSPARQTAAKQAAAKQTAAKRPTAAKATGKRSAAGRGSRPRR